MTHEAEEYAALHWGDTARRVDKVFLPQRQRFGMPIVQLASVAYSTTKAGKHDRWEHVFACLPRLCEVEPIDAIARNADLGRLSAAEARAIAAEGRAAFPDDPTRRGYGVLPVVDPATMVQLGALYELLDVYGRRWVLPGVDVAVAYDKMHEIRAVVLCGPWWLRYQIEIVYSDSQSAPYITDHGIEG